MAASTLSCLAAIFVSFRIFVSCRHLCVLPPSSCLAAIFVAGADYLYSTNLQMRGKEMVIFSLTGCRRFM